MNADVLAPVIARMPGDEWSRVWTGPGWWPLVARLDEALAQIDPDYSVQDVKTKLGGLRFYPRPSVPGPEVRQRFREAIDAAEAESLRTCEECGELGEHRRGDRLGTATLCATHWAERAVELG